MGHVVNPISFRLGVSRIWGSIWGTSSLFNYSNLLIQDLLYKQLLFGFFKAPCFKKVNILLCEAKIIRQPASISIWCFLYDASFEEFLFFFFSAYARFWKLFIKLKSPKFRSLLKKVANSSKSNVASLDASVLNSQFSSSMIRNFNTPTRDQPSLVAIVSGHFKRFLYFFLLTHVQLPFFLQLKHFLLHYFLKFNRQTLFIFSFIGVTNNLINAAALAYVISVKLTKLMRASAIINVLSKELERLMALRILLGFKIKLAGRFSRVQRASCLVKRVGGLHTSDVGMHVDYAYTQAKLRFSACSVKVWLAFSSNIDLYTILLKKAVRRFLFSFIA